MAKGAKYLSNVKFIATEAPTFFGYIISVLVMVLTSGLVYIMTFVCKRVATCLQIFNHLPTFLQVSELQAQLEQPEPS